MWKLLPYFLKQKISRNVMISSSINIEQGTFPVCGHQELRTLKVQSNWWKLWSYVRHMPHVRTPHRKKTVPSWRRQWNPTPVPLPGKSHGQRSLGGCSPWGPQRVRQDWATSLSLFTFMHWRRKWQPTPVFLPGESQGWRSLVGCRLWGCTESDTTEAT